MMGRMFLEPETFIEDGFSILAKRIQNETFENRDYNPDSIRKKVGLLNTYEAHSKQSEARPGRYLSSLKSIARDWLHTEATLEGILDGQLSTLMESRREFFHADSDYSYESNSMKKIPTPTPVKALKELTDLASGVYNLNQDFKGTNAYKQMKNTAMELLIEYQDEFNTFREIATMEKDRIPALSPSEFAGEIKRLVSDKRADVVSGFSALVYLKENFHDCLEIRDTIREYCSKFYDKLASSKMSQEIRRHMNPYVAFSPAR